MKNKVISFLIGFTISYFIFVIRNDRYLINFNNGPAEVMGNIAVFVILGVIFSYMYYLFMLITG